MSWRRVCLVYEEDWIRLTIYRHKVSQCTNTPYCVNCDTYSHDTSSCLIPKLKRCCNNCLADLGSDPSSHVCPATLYNNRFQFDYLNLAEGTIFAYRDLLISIKQAITVEEAEEWLKIVMFHKKFNRKTKIISLVSELYKDPNSLYMLLPSDLRSTTWLRSFWL